MSKTKNPNSNPRVKEALNEFIDLLEEEYGAEGIVGFEVNLERPIIPDERRRQGFSEIKEFILKYIVQDKIEL